MAFRCHRLVFHFKPGCSKLKLLDAGKSRLGLSSNVGQVANLTSTQSHGNEIQRAKPWPYDKRRYSAFWQFFDHTRKRFNDNSKIIVVDGNVASGKSEFGQKLAKEFNMIFIPDFVDFGIFHSEAGFDIRELNEQLPPGARSLDIETFHMQNAHPDMLKTIGRTQLAIYKARFFSYVAALEHLLNTGDGVVVERGPWNDLVFAEALRRNGYMSGKALNYYNQWRGNTICELWKPHLFIYLDAPISVTRQRINKRGRESEVNGKVVTDKYLQTIQDGYKKKMIPFYSKYSKVLQLDVTDMPDWEIIVEDLEQMDLDSNTADNEDLFEDWRKDREDDWNHYRALISSKWQLDNLFNIPNPWECPEMMLEGANFEEYVKIVHDHPDVMYKKGYNPMKESTLFKL